MKTTTNTKVVPFMPQKNRVWPHSALTQVTTRLISSKGVENHPSPTPSDSSLAIFEMEDSG